jgi:hypothetical protein
MTCTAEEEIAAATAGIFAAMVALAVIRDPHLSTRLIHLIAPNPDQHLERLDNLLKQMCEEPQEELPHHLTGQP